MNERTRKALSDMDRAIRILERLTEPKPEALRLNAPEPNRLILIAEAREKL